MLPLVNYFYYNTFIIVKHVTAPAGKLRELRYWYGCDKNHNMIGPNRCNCRYFDTSLELCIKLLMCFISIRNINVL